jgi:hypothetical protein
MEEGIRGCKEREPGSTYFGFYRSLSPIRIMNTLAKLIEFIKWPCVTIIGMIGSQSNIMEGN